MLAQIAGCGFHPGVDTLISRSENGKLRGGIIYQDYTVESIAAHVASLGGAWLNRDLLWAIFDYPFVHLKCRNIFTQTRSRNRKGLDFTKSLGFKEIVTIPEVFPDGEDVVVFRMRREECRWLRLKPTGILKAGNAIHG